MPFGGLQKTGLRCAYPGYGLTGYGLTGYGLIRDRTPAFWMAKVNSCIIMRYH